MVPRIALPLYNSKSISVGDPLLSNTVVSYNIIAMLSYSGGHYMITYYCHNIIQQYLIACQLIQALIVSYKGISAIQGTTVPPYLMCKTLFKQHNFILNNN